MIGQKFQNFMKRIKLIDKIIFFGRQARRDVFKFSERCENCCSTEGVKKVIVISGDNAQEKKFLCGSCAMVERCKAYIRNHKLKIKKLESEKELSLRP